MKQLNFPAIVILIGTILFSSCEDKMDLSGTSSSETEDTSPTRTVLVYMVADNSLNSYASLDIDEMVEGYAAIDEPENNRLLVYLDDYSTPRLLQITKEDEVVVIDTLQTYDELNSLSPSTMSTLINDALADFEADTYGLVLWSHGDGWLPGTSQDDETTSTRAFGEDLDNDANSDDGIQMDILDLKTALEACPGFEYILFDACEMQGIEVDYELRDCANYFVSSPNEIPAYGAPYEDVVPAMFTETDAALAVAEAYFGQYEQKYTYDPSVTSGPNNRSSGSVEGMGRYTGGTSVSSSYQYGVAVSVVASDALESLAAATKSILNTYITDGLTVEMAPVYNYDDNYYNFYYDLDGFIEQLTGGGDDYTSWKVYYDAAVPLFLTTDYTYSSLANDGEGGMTSMSDATGLSTYVPANADFYEASYWAYYMQFPRYVSMVEEYHAYFNEYYQGFAWYTAAGWNTSGW